MVAELWFSPCAQCNRSLHFLPAVIRAITKRLLTASPPVVATVEPISQAAALSVKITALLEKVWCGCRCRTEVNKRFTFRVFPLCQSGAAGSDPRCLHKALFKMLMQHQMIQCFRQCDWFKTVNLKDAIFSNSRTAKSQAGPLFRISRSGL